MKYKLMILVLASLTSNSSIVENLNHFNKLVTTDIYQTLVYGSSIFERPAMNKYLLSLMPYLDNGYFNTKQPLNISNYSSSNYLIYGDTGDNFRYTINPTTNKITGLTYTTEEIDENEQ